MRTKWWRVGLGLLLLGPLVTRPHSLGAEEPALERLVVDGLCQALSSPCHYGAPLITTADLWLRVEPLLEPAANAPPEDPLASDCWYSRDSAPCTCH